MLKNITSLLLFFFVLGQSHAQEDKEIAETVIHLLSYVSMDYSGAVENGVVIDEQEYLEQQEFSERALELTMESSFLKGEPKIEVIGAIEELINLVNDKDDEEEIKKMITMAKNIIIASVGLTTSPNSWPSLRNGEKLYALNCAQCHGVKGRGDGKLGEGLDPAPSNFYDGELMDNFSPYQAFNSIRLGVPGTGMQAYSNFSEEELWDLAFFIKAFRYQGGDSISLQKELKKTLQHISLNDISSLTDQELIALISKKGFSAPETKIQALRTITPSSEMTVNSLSIAREKLQEAYNAYAKGDKKSARNLAIQAYLEGIEPVESRIKSIDGGMVAEIERQMFQVRQAIDKDYSEEALMEEINKANIIIDELDVLLKGQQMNYWLTFLMAASIMLREGLEAFLIIAIIISLIQDLKLKKALPWLHGGWILAVFCGIVGWFLSDYIIQFGGKNREVMEGLISLFAVVILISVGFWLHNHTTAKKWQEFVEVRIGKYLNKDKMYGLAAFSFMIVFREVFEVILFLQAINLETGPQEKSAIGFGVIAAAITIAIIAYLFLKSTKKLPIRQVFQYSTWFIILLAIILIGKGIHSLQESGWVDVINISFIRVDWLGIYPTYQTLLGQLGLILLIIGTFIFNKARNK